MESGLLKVTGELMFEITTLSCQIRYARTISSLLQHFVGFVTVAEELLISWWWQASSDASLFG